MVSNKCKNSSLNRAKLAPIPSRILKRRPVESSQNIYRSIRDNVKDQDAILGPCPRLSNPSYPLKNINEESEGSRKYADLISSMPDDVLIEILSSLDLKEASRTSALSKRWRHVWAKLPDIYNFDFSGMRWVESNNDQIYYTGLLKFLDWVNQVLISTRARKNIDRFRVNGTLGGSRSDQVQSWVDFAMERCVKELELNLLQNTCSSLQGFGRFAQSPGAQTLVSVRLTTFRISSDFVASILSNLPNLECLTLRNCPCIPHRYIEIAGSSLKLKRLEISSCDPLKGIVINASNLNCLVFYGHVRESDIKVIYAPQLDEVAVAGQYAARVINNFPCFFSQLTKLNLYLYKFAHIRGIFDGAIQFPLFRRLKQLELEVYCCPDQSLVVLIDLIDACPVLHKFKLKRMRWPPLLWERPTRGVSRVSSKLHRLLREFEMVDFRGYEMEIEFVLYLLQFAMLLDKVIVHPLDTDIYGKNMLANATKQAQLLGLQLPSRVQLEIL